MNKEEMDRMAAWLKMQALGAGDAIYSAHTKPKEALEDFGRVAHNVSLDLRKFVAPRIQDAIAGAASRQESARLTAPMNVGIRGPAGQPNPSLVDMAGPLPHNQMKAEVPFRVQRAGDKAVGSYNQILESLGINPATLAGIAPTSPVTRPNILYQYPLPEIDAPNSAPSLDPMLTKNLATPEQINAVTSDPVPTTQFNSNIPVPELDTKPAVDRFGRPYEMINGTGINPKKEILHALGADNLIGAGYSDLDWVNLGNGKWVRRPKNIGHAPSETQ